MSRPAAWILAGAAFAFVAVVTYWTIALVVAEARKPDMVPPEKVVEYLHAVIEANRTTYTKNVVEKLQKQGVVEAVEHWKDEKGLPLPAQFLMESGRLLSEKGHKLSYRLASLTPIYVWNGPTSDFERRGLEAVMKEPDKPFMGFVRIGNARYFQGVYADRAIAPTCITCHNTHPNSPRRDYKLNDVMGGIVITIPISE